MFLGGGRRGLERIFILICTTTLAYASSVSTTNGSSMLSKAIIIHHATCCVNRSVSQAISPSVLFFVSATPLKLLNRILWNFVVMNDKLYKCAYLLKSLIHFFSSGNYALLNLKIRPKLIILLENWNSPHYCVVIKNTLCRCVSAGNLDSFFSGNYSPFELRSSSKMKYACTSETVCQHNSFDTT